MSRQNKSQTSKKKLIGFGLAGALGLALLGGGYVYLTSTANQTEMSQEMPLMATEVKEGSLASSTLLSGTVHALAEDYVYFDSSQNPNYTLTVNVGDKVTVGQQLVQYDATNAQAAYDQALRALNKVNRQINHLYTYGNQATTVTNVDEETGEETSTVIAPSAESTASYEEQLQDLYDAQADAQLAINKAQEGINQTIIVSDVNGTVVETNPNVDPSAKDSQVLVHVTSEGQLQVKGSLSEYDVANVKVGQTVRLTSKVYPDKDWAGKISYVSNYPSQNNANATGGSTTGASYDYKIDITSDLGPLRQGSTVSIEVVSEEKRLMVPVTAVLPEGDKNYVWVYNKDKKTINRVAVTLGKADALNQEVLTGLEKGQLVISLPRTDFKDNQKLEGVEIGDMMDMSPETGAEQK